MIQDKIMFICLIMFVYSIIPLVWYGFKQKKSLVPRQTSIITFVGLYICAICMVSLRLYWASMANFISATLWLIVFVQGVIWK